MKDFNSFLNNTQKQNEQIEKQLPQSSMSLIQDVAKQYEGKSENELILAIVAEAESRKRAGTLSNNDLDNFYSTISPMFSGKKKEKLKEVIDRLKGI